ncbi:MAG: RpiB/LacA/LacB family sugar-phosphate isomerase [Candidatus Paceibacterota bacterium]
MQENIKIHLATDHAGFRLKEVIKEYLDEAGYTVVDHGAGSLNEDDDYPDFIHLAARAVSEDAESVGIILGHSGQGEAMVANRYPYVRAAVYYGQPREKRKTKKEGDLLELTRIDDDANVLSLAAGFLSDEEAIAAVDEWLATDFSDAMRHQRRINKIDDNFPG